MSKSWMETFDKKFPERIFGDSNQYDLLRQEIKQFISKTIDEVERKWIAEIEKIAERLKTKTHFNNDSGMPCGEICWCGENKNNEALNKLIAEIKSSTK